MKETNNILKSFESLLELLKGINCNEIIKNNNYIEVAGFPHYENVMSNILAFFFDTHEEHNLNDLFVKSLLEVYKNKTNIDINTENFNMYTNTIREYGTPKGNRLDIVISGNYIIGIENKIYADLYNDLDDYYNALCQFGNGEVKIDEVVPIVLSLYDKEINDKHFVNITYTELINSINSNIGNYVFEGNNKWLLFYKEFALNVLAIKGDDKMDNLINIEYNKFLSNNEEIMKKVYNLIDEDIANKRQLLIELQKLITKYNFSLYQSQNDNFKSLYYQIKKNDNTNSKIKLEIGTKLNKIYLYIWQVSGGDGELNSIITKIQTDKNISFAKSDLWKYSYIIDSKDLVNDFDINSFAKDIENWCDIVKTYIDT